MNILYIGSSGVLSLLPFKKLRSSGYSVSAVGIYKPITIDNKVIAVENESLALAASQYGIPIIDMSQPVGAIIERCSAYSIDIILMSCYGKRLPDEIIGFPAIACYNMHPSLLPRFRGPEPVFWQMKLVSDTGVSWHQVIHDYDAGDIVAQKKVMLDDGMSYSEINLQLAQSGAELMLELLSELADDTLTGLPQDPAIASYYPYPGNHDFLLDHNRAARQLYNFMCATHAYGRPYLYRSGNLMFYLDKALDYDNNRSIDTVEIQGSKLYIPCNEGVLVATYTDKIPITESSVTHR